MVPQAAKDEGDRKQTPDSILLGCRSEHYLLVRVIHDVGLEAILHVQLFNHYVIDFIQEVVDILILVFLSVFLGGKLYAIDVERCAEVYNHA